MVRLAAAMAGSERPGAFFCARRWLGSRVDHHRETAMPTYAMSIDLTQCIGCHACTIACKSEHEVPLGVWRCWVKEVEVGAFPETKRHFLPVLCNQCRDAPCERICPTQALHYNANHIVDLDADRCIGCKAC